MNSKITKYKMIRGSDLDRDWFFYELNDLNNNFLAEIFISDITKKTTFTTNIDFEIELEWIELLISYYKKGEWKK